MPQGTKSLRHGELQGSDKKNFSSSSLVSILSRFTVTMF